MPLLKRKAFEKSTVSEYLRDDDEVFHCEVTDEIFKDYEEYCERIILVNSMVWSCEMTGKNNLTYAEALESEKAARRSLKDFPMELRIPILYLAAKTNRSSFAEMSEDVFNFVRDRYFVGEAVEACLEGDQWKEAQVLSVTSQKQQPGSKTVLPPTSYLYEVEQFVEDNPSGGQLGTAPHDRLRRRKGVYSRDKNRLFLKQFVEQGVGGIICIKKVALDKYNINKVVYDQLFTGNPPDFPSSKKLLKLSLSPHKSPSVNTSKLNKSLKKSPEKKGRQESMDKFVKKSDKTESPKPKPNPEAKKSAQELAERMRKAEEQMKQRKEDEKARKKETAAKLQAYLKEWQKVKDDLELEDHKIIPKGTPVEIEGIPQKHVGDFLSVLEFAYVYADILKVKDMFHNELDLETFRRALTTKENAGIFSDIIQMFLTTIFTLQEDEAEEYNEDGGILESTEDTQIKSGIGVTKAVELATKASKWSQTYLGTPLSKLPLDPTTVSEVLRLHVLSSGGAPGGRCATWRYHQRGGYSSPDDAGLHLRAHHPHLLRRLATTHVADLPTDEKFLVLQCLMNQILSYATVRDMIEEKAEEHKNTKQTLRLLQTNERKRDAQVAAARQELKKDCAAKKEGLKVNGVDQLKAKALEEELQTALEKLSKESEEKKHDYEKKLKELQIQLFDYVSYLGSDRAFRRYWVMQKVAGVFVEAGAEPRGACHKATPASPDPAAQTDPLVYVGKVLDSQRERGGSDKENESGANSRGGSPKKPLAHVNGVGRGQLSGRQELLVCTGDLDSCPAHGMIDRPQWWVYHTEDQIEGLIQSLNKRGFREHDLRQTLEMDKPNIVEYIKKCPVHLLNPVVAPPPPAPATRHRKFPQPSLNVPPECSLAEALELALRDHILELEEKIFHGCLGGLKIKDREAWRGTIMLRGYDKQADYLSWGPHRQYRDDYHQPNGVLKVPNGIEEADVKCIPENKYRDPGHYLEAARVNGARAVVAGGEATRSLASALLQVAQGIHHKYIKRPLGLDDKERKDREAKNKPLELETLERWEVSLMECRSVAQVVLHLFTLDSSVTWSASILNASCRLCRRKTDPDNMLLCDGCNKGHHLYCLKPKLSKVPEGDWFCDQCKPKERTPRKKRKLFSDEDIRDALEDSAGSDVDAGVCGACASGGRLRAACVACAARYHAECAAPPPSRAAKRWTCAACLAPTRESYDSDDNVTLGRLKRKRTSKEPSPLVNGAGSARKGRKSKDQTKTSLTNGVHDDRRSRKRRRSAEPVLHEDALAALTADVLRHKDSWPFYEPVSTDEVPDYLDVIKQPMDFSTIKEKLFSGEYSTDYEFMSDAALVFTNCYTYNQDVHPVARAGVRLEKYFNKRCEELNLQTLPTTNLELDTEEAHNGSSSSYDEDQPKVKKLKLK